MNYPIDIEATKGKWVIYDTETGKHTRMGGNGNWPNGDGTEITRLDSSLVPLLIVEQPQPDYDSTKERLQKAESPNIRSNELIKGWEKVAFTAEEKAEIQSQGMAVAAYNAAAEAFAALPLGKQALWEGVRVAVSEAILVGDFAKAKETLLTTPLIYLGAEADRDTFLALFP